MAARGPPKFTETPLLWLQHALIPWSAEEKEDLKRTIWFRKEGSGYYNTQSTKPATLGFAFADSPMAVLAWIYEKLHDWTDRYPWTDDEILTWVSVYIFSRAGPEASVRIYYETKHAPAASQASAMYNGKVALGISLFPKDIVLVPTLWLRGLGPIAFSKRHKSGGHFAAYEKPNELADDLQTMFSSKGGAHAVTKSLPRL